MPKNSRKSQNKLTAFLGSKEELDSWAKALVAAVGKVEVQALLADYVALSGNSKVTKVGREVAKERARALKKYM